MLIQHFKLVQQPFLKISSDGVVLLTINMRKPQPSNLEVGAKFLVG